MNEPKTFDEVREFLSRIYSIHGGGCGVAALAMYKWLKKNNQLTYDFKFVICYDPDYDDDNRYLNNMKVLRTKEGKAMATSHMGIINGGVPIDSWGSIQLTRYGLIQFVAFEWFMTNMINNKGSWNSEFNRDESIPLIEKTLDIDLSEIKINKT
jgi:hypothetical protein